MRLGKGTAPSVDGDFIAASMKFCVNWGPDGEKRSLRYFDSLKMSPSFFINLVRNSAVNYRCVFGCYGSGSKINTRAGDS
jgi:hypothetical protein